MLVPEIVAGLPGLRAIAALLPVGESRFTVLATPAGLDVSVEGKFRSPNAKAAAAMARIAADHRFARITLSGETIIERASPMLQTSGVGVVPPPGAFVQAVAQAEDALAAAVLDRIGRPKRATDLFCGLGTFALALARRSRVAAFDSDQAAIAALQAAVRHASGLKPVEARVRDLFREPLSPLELAPFDAVVLDPPRAGAKAQCEALAKSKVPQHRLRVLRPRHPGARCPHAGRRRLPARRSGADRPVPVLAPRRAGRRVHALMPSRSAPPLNGPPTNICHLGVCWWGGWGTALLGEVLHACVGMAVHRAVLGERAPYAGRPRRPSAGSRAVPRPQPASPRPGCQCPARPGSAQPNPNACPRPQISSDCARLTVTRGRRRNRKLHPTPRPTLHQVPPRRSAPGRHVWLEARASAGAQRPPPSFRWPLAQLATPSPSRPPSSPPRRLGQAKR